MDMTEVRAHCLSKPGAVEDFPFGEGTPVCRVGGKIFALAGIEKYGSAVNLKCDPGYAEALRDMYPAVIPGYHMNKRNWNTVILDGSIPDEEVRGMIDHSYGLVVQSLPRVQREALGKG